jgi:hypothetical protein
MATFFSQRTAKRARFARRYLVAVLLVVALGGHQFVMASSLHLHVMAAGVFAAVQPPTLHHHVPDTDSTTDDATEPHHLAPCPVEEARLVTLVALSSPFLAVVVLLVLLAAWGHVAFSDTCWLWPPNRRRALLHVFLC